MAGERDDAGDREPGEGGVDVPAAGAPAGRPSGGDGEPVSLDLVPSRVVRGRALGVAIAAVVLGAAFGGAVGFFAGRIVGLVVAAVVAVPVLVGALAEARRTTRLDGGLLVARGLLTRRVELGRADRLELLVTTVRGRVTVSMLVAGPPAGRRAVVCLAVYEGARGAELGILALRRLADALAGADDTRALVFSQLLVAVLRAEARGEPAESRPLRRVAALASGGTWGRRVTHEALSAFVAALP